MGGIDEGETGPTSAGLADAGPGAGQTGPQLRLQPGLRLRSEAADAGALGDDLPLGEAGGNVGPKKSGY